MSDFPGFFIPGPTKGDSMDPITGTGSAALKVFGMTAGQLNGSPAHLSSAGGRADSTVGPISFSSGAFSVGTGASAGGANFATLFAIAALAGALAVFVLRAHK